MLWIVFNVGVLWLNIQVPQAGFFGVKFTTRDSYFVLDGAWVHRWKGWPPHNKSPPPQNRQKADNYQYQQLKEVHSVWHKHFLAMLPFRYTFESGAVGVARLLGGPQLAIPSLLSSFYSYAVSNMK